jgi:methylthioribose-1-phosphate isomerase
MRFKSIEPRDGKLRLLDQRRLPAEIIYNDYDDYRDIIAAIKSLEVRGAPAIGIAGAFALAIAARANISRADVEHLKRILTNVASEIEAARPTAVNLSWAVKRTLNAASSFEGDNLDEFRQFI